MESDSHFIFCLEACNEYGQYEKHFKGFSKYGKKYKYRTLQCPLGISLEKNKTGEMMHIPVKNVFLSTMWYLKKKYNMILSNNECCFIFLRFNGFCFLNAASKTDSQRQLDVVTIQT